MDAGYTLFDKWELRARNDRLNRGTDATQFERHFETLTLGVTYRFNAQVRVLADYDFATPIPRGGPPAPLPTRFWARWTICSR